MELEQLIGAVNNEYHKYYDLVVEESEKWTSYVTGVDLNERLKRFERRESEKEFEQRELLTVHVSPSTSNKVRNSFQKVYRASGVKESIAGDKAVELKEAIQTFNGPKSLTSVLEEAYLRLNLTSPESYLLMDVDPFDNNTETAPTKIVEIPVQNVCNYKYEKETLISLTFKESVKYMLHDKEVDGFSIIQINNDFIIKLTPVDPKTVGNTSTYKEFPEQNGFYYNTNLYEVRYVTNTLGYVPAKKPGYILDILTKGVTTDSIIQAAMPYYEKQLTMNSEHDLSNRLHAFPQKSGIYPRCTEKDCLNGYHRVEETECEKCKGLGFVIPVHSSAQDYVGVPAPKPGEPMPDIDKIFKYTSVDTTVLDYQHKELTTFEEKIFECIFNNDIFTKVQVEQTATEVNSQKDHVNDTFYRFAKGFAEVWAFFVKTLADYRDLATNTSWQYIFPNDFKLDTLEELMEAYRKAIENNSPSFMVNQIALDIASKVFADNPAELAKFRAVQRINPFSGESNTQIQNKISTQSVTRQDVFLYANLNRVIKSLDMDDPEWFTFPMQRISELVDEKISELDPLNNLPQLT